MYSHLLQYRQHQRFPSSLMALVDMCCTRCSVMKRSRLTQIVSAGSQQLLCRHQQTTLGITSNEMLLYTSWPMAALLLTVGPTLDSIITGGSWVFAFDYSPSNVVVIVATCVLAVGVNLSQFACLGRFSAVAYQVRFFFFTFVSSPLSHVLPQEIPGVWCMHTVMFRSSSAGIEAGYIWVPVLSAACYSPFQQRMAGLNTQTQHFHQDHQHLPSL